MRYFPRSLVRLSLAICALTASVAHADARSEFCAVRRSGEILEIADDDSMRLPFENEGGLADGGVCWWHSRFQRAAWFLASFRPDLPKPNVEGRRRIVRRIASRMEVVEVPGYRDLSGFATENERLIQRELEAWQIRDAVINQAYIRGLSGRSEFRDPKRMKRHMDHLYRKYLSATRRREVLWVMLQTEGIESHSSLVRSIRPTPNGGYLLHFVDSNFPRELIEYRYAPGDTALVPENGYSGWVEWIPYVGLARDHRRIDRAIDRYCRGAGPAANSPFVPPVTQGSSR